MALGSIFSMSGVNSLITTPSAAAKPASKNTAPIMASKASANTDGRRQPPLFNSPSPSFKASPILSVNAISPKVGSFTKWARKRLRSPSSSLGNLR